MQEEDDAWLDSLAGRPGADSSAEGTALRAGIRAYGENSEPVAAHDAAREAVLLERARLAGLLGPARPAAAARRFGGVRRSAWLVAATLACLCVGISVQMRDRPAAPIVRGGRSPMSRLHSADPAMLQRQLIQELGAVGIQARGYESLGRWGIDADLPAPLPDAARRVLERHGIAAPPGGVLQVEIESP